MDEREFDRLLKEKTKAIEAVLNGYLPEETGPQRTVAEAMNYSLTAGGKRLRPLLMWETYLMCGGRGRLVEPFLAAIEMIHTYSLVHDDLPAMDNDEYRRGRRTTWYVYGDAMGILAGDGLLNYAYETALRAFDFCGDDAEAMGRTASALRTLAEKAGIYGMVGGQAADIKVNADSVHLADADSVHPAAAQAAAQENLLFIHEHKTAALIQAAMMAGAILAGASAAQVKRLERCARSIGVAFQIQDDILDVTGDSEELGKPVGSDAQNHKQTYVTLKGLKESEREAAALSEEAVAILDGFEAEHEFLTQLILALIHRRK